MQHFLSESRLKTMERIKINDLLADKEKLQKFCNDMANGAVAVVPTDTLYGFAVSYNSPEAVQKVYNIKNRDARKPLILFITHTKELQELSFVVSEEAGSCIQKHWPGALTAVLPKPQKGELANFNFPTVGVRAPNHAALLKLMEILPVRLLTTSANRSGAPSDTNPDVIAEEFKNEIDWLLDDGILPVGIPSTVADFSAMPPKILRQGAITL